MAEIELLPVASADLTRLRELALITWEPTYRDILSQEQIYFMQEEIYAETALQEQARKGQQFYFITRQLEPIGFAGISVLIPEEGRYKLNKLYLIPEMQGKGFGRAAIEAAAELVRKQSGKVLELNVNRFNRAKDFYERCGFTVIREEDIPIGAYWMNDFVMAKKLD